MISGLSENTGWAIAYVEPGNAAPRPPQQPFLLAASHLLEPIQRPTPILRFDVAKVVFLLVEIGCKIMAHEREEARYSISGVAFAYKLAVDGVSVEHVREQCGPRVDRNDEEDTYDVFLFVWVSIVQCVLHDVEDGNSNR